MKITDALAIISNRLAAGATDKDTATEQIRVLVGQYDRDPHDLVIDLALEVWRLKTTLAVKNRNG